MRKFKNLSIARSLLLLLLLIRFCLMNTNWLTLRSLLCLTGKVSHRHHKTLRKCSCSVKTIKEIAISRRGLDSNSSLMILTVAKFSNTAWWSLRSPKRCTVFFFKTTLNWMEGKKNNLTHRQKQILQWISTLKIIISRTKDTQWLMARLHRSLTLYAKGYLTSEMGCGIL